MSFGRGCLAVLLLAAASPAAEAASAGTPRLDYLLHCSGCHGPTGTGVPSRGIPRLRGEVAKFLWVPQGRAYLAQVPGVRNANLDDAEVARLLDWLPGAMDPAHLPPTVAPFLAEEVGRLRRAAQGDVLAQRAAAGELLAAQGIELRSYQD